MSKEYERFCFLQSQIFEILSELNEKDRYSWTLSLVANFLHDIPTDLREEFFEKYGGIKEEVNKIMVKRGKTEKR